MRENYMNDPRKLINTPSAMPPGGGYGREGGFRGGYQNQRGGYRRFDNGRDGGPDGHGPRSNRAYFDYDDPTKYQN